MFNPYGPYIGPISSGSSLLKGLSFSSILSGTQKTLNIVNQAIPIVYQVKPLFKNAKTFFKVAKEFNNTNSSVSNYNDINYNNIKEVNSNNPNFFI